MQHFISLEIYDLEKQTQQVQANSGQMYDENGSLFGRVYEIGRYLVDDLGTYMVDQIISALDIDGSDILVSLYPEEESIMIEISSDDDYDASHGLSYGLSDFCENWTMTKNVFAIDGKAYNIDPIFMG